MVIKYGEFVCTLATMKDIGGIIYLTSGFHAVRRIYTEEIFFSLRLSLLWAIRNSLKILIPSPFRGKRSHFEIPYIIPPIHGLLFPFSSTTPKPSQEAQTDNQQNTQSQTNTNFGDCTLIGLFIYLRGDKLVISSNPVRTALGAAIRKGA